MTVFLAIRLLLSVVFATYSNSLCGYSVSVQYSVNHYKQVGFNLLIFH